MADGAREAAARAAMSSRAFKAGYKRRLDVHGEHPGVFLGNEEQHEAVTHVVRLVRLIGRALVPRCLRCDSPPDTSFLFGAVFGDPAPIGFGEGARESSGFEIPAVSRRSGLLPPGRVAPMTPILMWGLLSDLHAPPRAVRVL